MHFLPCACFGQEMQMDINQYGHNNRRQRGGDMAAWKRLYDSCFKPYRRKHISCDCVGASPLAAVCLSAGHSESVAPHPPAGSSIVPGIGAPRPHMALNRFTAACERRSAGRVVHACGS